MNDGLHFLDIIFFAMVAAFLVLRLRSVLGRRTGAERPPPERLAASNGPVAGNVVDLRPARPSPVEPSPSSPVGIGLAAIRAADRGFDLDGFLAGARAAFEMIVAAYARDDKAALQPLLTPEVYRNFAAAIDARRRNNERLETELSAVRAVDLVEASMQGSDAVLTVRFVSEQVNLLRGSDGQVVEGDPDRATEVVDLWSFRRNVRSPDPNWFLSATRTPEEES
jgi:predicted lipid-binding transport protein (Tim44 family)